MFRSLLASQYLPNLRPQRFGFTTWNLCLLTSGRDFAFNFLTVFAIFLSPWYSLFSRMLFRFRSSSLNFHSTTWWSPMLPNAARDFECSAWKIFVSAVLNDTRSFGEHFLRGALLLAIDDRFWFAFPAQFGRPFFVWVFWIGLPCALTHQQPLFSRHWMGA